MRFHSHTRERGKGEGTLRASERRVFEMKGLLFTYLLTYGGSLASLLNPFWGLLVYVCFSIIKPDAMWSWAVPQGHYSRIIAIAMLFGWVVHGAGRWDFGRARGIVAALVGLWLWSVVGALTAPNQAVAWNFVESLGKVVLPFIVGITVVDSVRKLKQLAWVMVLSQGYVAFEMNLSYYSGFNLVHMIGFGGMDNNSVAIAMVAGAGLAFFLALSESKWWQKMLAGTGALLMAHTVMLAFSRGGMLALIITALVSFLLLPRQPKYYLAFTLAVLVGLRLAGPDVTARFTSTFVDPQERDASAQSRLELWADNWDVMQRNPLLGAGPDHWPLIAHKYGWPPGKEGHSLWLQIGAELGFPGLVFLLTFYCLCIVRLWPFARGRIEVPDPWFCDVARMVIASIAGFAVAAMFVTLEGLELPYYVVLLGAGALKLAPTVRLMAAAPTGATPSSSPALLLRRT